MPSIRCYHNDADKVSATTATTLPWAHASKPNYFNGRLYRPHRRFGSSCAEPNPAPRTVEATELYIKQKWGCHELPHRVVKCPPHFQQLAQGLCEAPQRVMQVKGCSRLAYRPRAKHPQPGAYISSGYIEQQFADLLPLTRHASGRAGRSATVSTRPGQVAVVEAMAAQAGFDLPPGTIGALFDGIDVTDVYEVGRTRLALGLAVITEEAAVRHP